MINWITDECLSFDQLKDKYKLTIQEVMEQYAQYRASL